MCDRLEGYGECWLKEYSKRLREQTELYVCMYVLRTIKCGRNRNDAK